MPHIFRFHAGRNNNIYDWKVSDKIMPADVREVMDKTNILTSAAGTSIPTPIARMFLFKTAFEIIAAQVRDNKVDEKGIYAGLVSETLDLLELLYKCGDDESKFRYQKWVFDNTQQDDNVILPFFGEQHGHKLLAESFKQAVGQAPFGNRLEITLIYYREGNNEILVGGTSPFSFVFTSPNFARKLRDRGFREIAGLVSDDILFDSDYKQLHERDESFIRYVESLVNTEGIADSFRGITEYVINTKNRFFKKFNGPIHALQDIQIGDVMLTAARINLKQIHEEDYKQQINNDSDFRLELPDDTHYNEKLRPLFLLDRMEHEGQYTSPTNKWSVTTRVSENQYAETTLAEIMQRELPGIDGISYPFVTAFDFFERCLVKMPDYVLNSDKFLTVVDGQQFALPLKPLFFQFYPIHRIKDYLSVEVKGDQVTFILSVRIFGPTRGRRTITYKKTYTADTTVQYSGILGIYPFTRANQLELLHTNKYTVAAFEKTNAPIPVNNIVFYKKTGIHIVQSPMMPRSDYAASRTKSSYYQLNESFDIIQLNFKKDNAGLGCVIIPKFIEVENGTEEYIYAIDFGTSNTHIEYGRVMTDNITETKPFAIDERKMQIAMLHKPKEMLQNDGAIRYNDYERSMGNEIDAARQLTLREFVPFQIGAQQAASIKFPFRTATFESNSFVVNEENNKLFINANIGFLIDEDTITSSDELRYTTNLKWKLEAAGSDKLNRNRVSLFFQELLLLIRTKVLLEDNTTRGDIKKLKFALSFPISMGNTLKNNLISLFEAQKKEIIGADAQPIREVSESIAPYYQLRFVNINIQNDSFCNIDIGGGTTDIVLIDKNPSRPNELKCYCSSFKFAGRQLWGSGHNEFNIMENGFIAYYKAFIEKNDATVYRTLGKVLGSNDSRSEDVVGLLFSKPEYKFGEIFAENKELRVVPILHYTAILFYIAKLAKMNGVALPRTVSFSGKGSEYLNLIFPSKDDLKGFTQKVLGIFAGTPVRNDFMIEKSNEPKVITAKGAVHFANEKVDISDDAWGNNTPSTSNSSQKKLELVSSTYRGFNDLANENRIITYADLQNNSPLFVDIMKSLDEFFNLLFNNPELCRAINLKLEIKDFAQYKQFFVPAPSMAKVTGADGVERDEMVSNTANYGRLRDSFLAVLAKMPPGDTVSDSPFFFALSYSLVELTREIAQKQ
jgi:hypothetical protein